MSILISIVVSFLLMEVVAWAIHKYIMHGIGWNLHEDHHNPNLKRSFFEWNDMFFVFFSLISVSFLSFWMISGLDFLLGISIGVILYGVTYLLLHDIFIHQRVKFWRNTNNRYLKAARRAHKIHHKNMDRHGGECFGMLWVPIKYYKSEQ